MPVTIPHRSGRLLLAAALLALARPAAAQQLSFRPYHPDGTYAVGERVGWTVTPDEGHKTAGQYTYTIKRDGFTLLRTGTLDLSTGRATIEATLPAPGMLLVEIRPPAGVVGFHGASKAEVGRVLLGAAVAPGSIPPAAPRPADFDSFWTAKIGELEAIPAEPVLTPGESEKAGVEWATLRMNNVNGAHVYGQVAKPAAAGRYPALLILQWASPPYPLQKSWVTERAAEGWLVLNVEPHDVPADMPQAFYDALPTMIKRYAGIGLHGRDENYFLPMYLGDYRAAEYLAGRPDWDGRTLAVMGTSMGGQQSFAVAGLNRKVTAMLANVPAGADLTGPLYGRAAGYPSWDPGSPEVRALAPYFDAVNFAPLITARSLVAMGYIDETCPPAGVWSAFNLIRGPKEAAPMLGSPHNHLATPEQSLPWTRRSAAWLDALVHGREPVPVAPSSAGVK